MNCVLDKHLDRSTQTSQLINSSIVVNNMLSSTYLVYVWRLCKPTSRDYSYFSQVQKSDPRIDYFLLDSNLISKVVCSMYHSILILDHSQTSLVLQLCGTKQQCTWRFHPSLLSEASFCRLMTTKISEGLETNDKQDVSDSILWKTFKVLTQGENCFLNLSWKKNPRNAC